MTETTWQQWAITITTFLPIAGAVVVLFVPSAQDRAIRAIGVFTTALGVGRPSRAAYAEA